MGRWMLDAGRWTLDAGRWTLDADGIGRRYRAVFAARCFLLRLPARASAGR